ncbi:MAG: hydrogenase nickel incorporation protein HypB [candidate division FCPU426 bacterium]
MLNNISIKIYRDILHENNSIARENKSLLKNKMIKMFNLIGSPGAGKTSLLEGLNKHLLNKKIRFAVLEGDVETTRDSERLDKLGIKVSQLLTGGSCHLEASLIHQALNDLDLSAIKLIFVENVGNMVCPAEFDLGEDAKIAVLSVTEGEDKPIKYPLLFHEAKAVIITKTDLLPHLKYDLDSTIGFIHEINSKIKIFQVSALMDRGILDFCEWIINY